MNKFLVEARLQTGVRYFELTNVDADTPVEAHQTLLDSLNDGELQWVPMSPTPALKQEEAALYNLAHVVALRVIEAR